MKIMAKKTIQITCCKRFDSSCYHHQCIANLQNFWTRNAWKSIKGCKDSYCSL